MLKRDKIIAAAFVVQIVGCATYYTVRSHRVDSAPLRRVYIDAEALIGSRTQILGRQNTPFTLVEFADYQCPPCARANSEIKKILDKNGRQKQTYQWAGIPEFTGNRSETIKKTQSKNVN